MSREAELFAIVNEFADVEPTFEVTGDVVCMYCEYDESKALMAKHPVMPGSVRLPTRNAHDSSCLWIKAKDAVTPSK